MCSIEIDCAKDRYIELSAANDASVAEVIGADIGRGEFLRRFIDESLSIGCVYTREELAELITGAPSG